MYTQRRVNVQVNWTFQHGGNRSHNKGSVGSPAGIATGKLSTVTKQNEGRCRKYTRLLNQ